MGNSLIIGMDARTANIVQVDFSLRRWAQHCQAPISVRICSTVLAPTCMSPSAAHSFTCANPSVVVPVAHLTSSTVPGLAFSHFPTTWTGSTFAPPSATFPGFAYAGTDAQTIFQGGITPRNVPVHAHFSLGPPLNLEKTRKF